MARYSDVPALIEAYPTSFCQPAIEPGGFRPDFGSGTGYGKIVVASNIGGSLDTIKDGVTGKLYQYDNPQALADALDWALSLSDAEKAAIGKAGIKNVKENFTKEIMCDKTIKVYKELVNS